MKVWGGERFWSVKIRLHEGVRPLSCSSSPHTSLLLGAQATLCNKTAWRRQNTKLYIDYEFRLIVTVSEKKIFTTQECWIVYIKILNVLICSYTCDFSKIKTVQGFGINTMKYCFLHLKEHFSFSMSLLLLSVSPNKYNVHKSIQNKLVVERCRYIIRITKAGFHPVYIFTQKSRFKGSFYK